MLIQETRLRQRLISLFSIFLVPTLIHLCKNAFCFEFVSCLIISYSLSITNDEYIVTMKITQSLTNYNDRLLNVNICETITINPVCGALPVSCVSVLTWCIVVRYLCRVCRCWRGALVVLFDMFMRLIDMFMRLRDMFMRLLVAEPHSYQRSLAVSSENDPSDIVFDWLILIAGPMSLFGLSCFFHLCHLLFSLSPLSI